MHFDPQCGEGYRIKDPLFTFKNNIENGYHCHIHTIVEIDDNDGMNDNQINKAEKRNVLLTATIIEPMYFDVSFFCNHVRFHRKRCISLEFILSNEHIIDILKNSESKYILDDNNIF